MYGSSLHHDITFVHGRLQSVVEDQLDGALEDHSEVHALRAVHKVDIVLEIAHRREVNNPTKHTRWVDEANLLAVYVDEGGLGLGWNAICLV